LVFCNCVHVYSTSSSRMHVMNHVLIIHNTFSPNKEANIMNCSAVTNGATVRGNNINFKAFGIAAEYLSLHSLPISELSLV